MADPKLIMKRVALGVAFIAVLPFILISRLGTLLGCDDFFSAFASFLALAPGKSGSYIRLAFYKGTLESISSDVYIGFGSFFSRRGAIVGNKVNIGSYCILGLVTIGDRVLVASRVSIPSGRRQHALRYDEENPSEELTFDRITIGNECWLGEGSIILADVGERCIVSAGSVITRAMPSNRIIGGNPARVLPETLTGKTLQESSS